MNEEQIAARAMELIAAKQMEQAALLLHRELGSRMQRYFERHRVPPEDARELTTDVWMRLLSSTFDQRTRAVVWMWTLARSILVDWVRAQGAQSRGRSMGGNAVEVTLDEDEWEVVGNHVAHPDVPEWVKLCVERAIFQLEQDDPNRAHVLWLWHQGWSAEEMAVHFGAPPPPNEKHKTAARNRVLEATRKAKDYFAHCQGD